MDDPKVQAFVEKNGLKNDVHELYRHFLIRMNDMIKGYGKKMCVWEGFGPEGEVEIPKDIIVFEFEIFEINFNLSSLIETFPTFGSIVQKG